MKTKLYNVHVYWHGYLLFILICLHSLDYQTTFKHVYHLFTFTISKVHEFIIQPSYVLKIKCHIKNGRDCHKNLLSDNYNLSSNGYS